MHGTGFGICNLRIINSSCCKRKPWASCPPGAVSIWSFGHRPIYLSRVVSVHPYSLGAFSLCRRVVNLRHREMHGPQGKPLPAQTEPHSHQGCFAFGEDCREGFPLITCRAPGSGRSRGSWAGAGRASRQARRVEVSRRSAGARGRAAGTGPYSAVMVRIWLVFVSSVSTLARGGRGHGLLHFESWWANPL